MINNSKNMPQVSPVVACKMYCKCHYHTELDVLWLNCIECWIYVVFLRWFMLLMHLWLVLI